MPRFANKDSTYELKIETTKKVIYLVAMLDLPPCWQASLVLQAEGKYLSILFTGGPFIYSMGVYITVCIDYIILVLMKSVSISSFSLSLKHTTLFKILLFSLLKQVRIVE